MRFEDKVYIKQWLIEEKFKMKQGLNKKIK